MGSPQFSNRLTARHYAAINSAMEAARRSRDYTRADKLRAAKIYLNEMWKAHRDAAQALDDLDEFLERILRWMQDPRKDRSEWFEEMDLLEAAIRDALAADARSEKNDD